MKGASVSSSSRRSASARRCRLLAAGCPYRLSVRCSKVRAHVLAVRTKILIVCTEPSQLVESPVDIYPSAHTAANESGISVLKQSLRMSVSGAVRLYKSSTQLLGRSTPALTLGSDGADEEEESRSASLSPRASWEDEELVGKGESGLVCAGVCFVAVGC